MEQLRLGRVPDPLDIEDQDDELNTFKSADEAYSQDVVPLSRPADPEPVKTPAPVGKTFEFNLYAPPVAPDTSPAKKGGAETFTFNLYGDQPQPTSPKPAPKAESGDTYRGASAALRQTPAMLKGAVGLAGAAGEKAFGEGGMFTALKKYGLEGFQKGMAEVQADAKDTDELTTAWEKAKGGDLGALVDWAQYGIGYLGGNVVETLGTALLGSAIGTVAAPGVGTLGGAVAGATGKEAVKGVARNLIEGMVAKEAAKLAEKAGVETATEAMVKQATKSVARNIGATSTMAASSILKESGGIYGEAVEAAGTDNLSGGDLARVFGAGVVAGLSEFALDKLGLDAAAGKLKIPGGGRVGRTMIGGTVGAGLEGGTEMFQTAVERFGAGKELTGEEAMRDYINSAALGALGGGTFGSITGALRSGKEEDVNLVKKVLQDAQKDMESDAGRQQIFDSMMQDEKMRPILEANGIQSWDDPRFQSVVTRSLSTQRLLAELQIPSAEEVAQTTKERGADVQAAFGDTASTGTGVGTGANEPVIRRDSVVPDATTKELIHVEGQAQQVVLPEGKNTPAGTVAMSGEDMVSRQQGYEVLPAMDLGDRTVANRFISRQQAETFLFGPINKETGKREGGYASSVVDMEFQIRQGQRSKEAGGGVFYFVEGREKQPDTNSAGFVQEPTAQVQAQVDAVAEGRKAAAVAGQQEAAAVDTRGLPATTVTDPATGASSVVVSQDAATGQQAQQRTEEVGIKQAMGETLGYVQPNATSAPKGDEVVVQQVDNKNGQIIDEQAVSPENVAAVKPVAGTTPQVTSIEDALKGRQQEKKAPAAAAAKPPKKEAKPPKQPKVDKTAARKEAIELWEDNDDGSVPHVPFNKLGKERQQEWLEAYWPEDGKPYASAELHDDIVDRQLKSERVERANKKAADNKPDETVYRTNSRPNRGMTKARVEQVYAKMAQTWSKVPSVEVVQSEADLPANEQEKIKRAGASGKVPGLFINGKVYLVADNIVDVNDAIVTVAHEVTGHFGLRQLLGQDYPKVMNDIYRGNKMVREAADKMVKSEGLSREIAVEEVLADMAEENARLALEGKPVPTEVRSALQKIYAAIRKFMRSIGVSFVSDGDVRQLVANARRYVIDGDIEARQGTASFDTAFRAGTPTFYSAMEREVRSAKQNSAPAKDWRAIISKLPGVKKEEIEWTGVDEWLETKGSEKVSKEDLLNWIAGNKLHLNDIVLVEGEQALTLSNLKEMYEEQYPDPSERTIDIDSASREDLMAELGFEQDRGARHSAEGKRLRLPGGRDYVELILTEPSRKTRPYKRTDDVHFGDVSGGKAIGWLRMNLRKDKDGNDVLFIEELQSQRGQDGRDQGFGLSASDEKRIDGLKAQLAKLSPEVSRFNDRMRDLTDEQLDEFNALQDERAALTKQINAITKEIGEIESKAPARGAVPDAPFVKDTKAWTSLLLKRAVAYAQEKGVDRIAWTTGKQQNERYAFPGDEIVYVKEKGKDTVTLTVMQRGREMKTVKDVPVKDLKSYVGERAAARITAGEGVELDNSIETSGSLKGDDLKLMDANLEPYYNQTVPSVAKDLIKKFGGSTVVMDIEGTGQQLGFVVPEKLRQTVAEDGLPLFRRKDYEAQYDDLPDDVKQRAYAKGHYSPPNIKERLEALKPNLWLRVVQGTFDRFRSVRDISLKAYMQLRLSQSTDGAAEGLLYYGQVFDDDGALNLKKGTKGLLEILAPVGAETDRFLLWVAANRADKLSKQERERFFSSEDIAALKRINVGTMKDGKSRVAVYAETLRQMNELNKSVLEVAKSSGLIDEAAYNRFAADIWYVPFYRQMDEDRTLSAAQTSSASVGQYLSKKLKGSERPLNDLMENVLLNWSHILSASMKNKAANTTLDAAQKMNGIVTKLDKQEKGAVKTMLKGKETYWRIDDEFLLASLDAVASMPDYGWFTNLAREFKTTLTRFIALSPTFKINNLIRDSVQSVGLTELEKNPLSNVAQGWRAYKDERAEALVGGGIFTLGNAFDGDQAAQVKRLLKAGVKNQDILTTADKAKAWFGKAQDKYDEVSDRLENANRLALYQQLRSKGASHLEAAYAARDLQDFSLQGSWTAIRYAAQVLPYFNARLQGMYKLGRDGVAPSIKALMGNANDSERQKAAKFATVMTAVTMTGVALYLANRDDEDFKKREDWDRDAFFWFKIPGTDLAARIPKPFEMGAVSTIAERLVEQIVDKDVEGKVFGKRLGAVLADNLAINIIPQIVRPLWDVARNKDGFTDRPIESMGQERVSPENRISSGTSAAAVGIGKINAMFAEFASAATGKAIDANTMKLSPVQYDYLIKNYLGWVGTVIHTVSNYAVEPFKPGEMPDMKLDDVLLIGNYVKSMPQSQSKYVTSFYENAKAMTTAVSDYRLHVAAGDIEKATEVAREKRDLIALNKLYSSTADKMAQISKRLKAVKDDETMDGERKRLEMDRLSQLRIQYAKRAEEIRIARQRQE